MFFFALFLMTAWPGFAAAVMGIDWYWYLMTAVILSLPLFVRIFSK